jgi:hypothetical protein
MAIGTAGAMFTTNAVDSDRPVWNEVYFYEYGYAKVIFKPVTTSPKL